MLEFVLSQDSVEGFLKCCIKCRSPGYFLDISYLRDPREILPPLTSLLNTPEFLLVMEELENEEKEEEDAE